MIEKIREQIENLLYPELRSYGRRDRDRLLREAAKTPLDFIDALQRSRFWFGGAHRGYGGQFPRCAYATWRHRRAVPCATNETWTALAAALRDAIHNRP